MTLQFNIRDVNLERLAAERLFWNNDLHAKIRAHAYEMMEERHDPSFRTYIKDHCKFVGAQTERMLLALGWSPEIARARGEDAELHDIGKMHPLQVGLWIFTEKKPDKSSRPAFESETRAEHTMRGPEVLDKIIDDLGQTYATLMADDQARLNIISYLQINHHRPSSLTNGVLLDVVRTVDTVAGQLKTTENNVIAAIAKLRENPAKFASHYNPDYLDLFESLHKNTPAPGQVLDNHPKY